MKHQLNPLDKGIDLVCVFYHVNYDYVADDSLTSSTPWLWTFFFFSFLCSRFFWWRKHATKGSNRHHTASWISKFKLVRHVPGNDHYQDETEMWRTVEHSVKFQGRLNVINDQKSIQFSVSVYSIRMPNPKQVMEFVWLSMANEMWKKTSLIRRFLCRCLFFYSVAHHLYQLISQFEERKRRREKNVEGRCIRLIHIRSFILSFPLPFFLQPDCGSYMAINTSFRS